MPVVVERVPDEPVVIATYSGVITLEDVKHLFAQTAALTADVEGHRYRISDFHDAQSTFGDIVQIMGEARTGASGSSSDPNLTTIFVGSNEWGAMVRNFFTQGQYGGLNIPTVTSIEEAWEFIREDQAKRNA